MEYLDQAFLQSVMQDAWHAVECFSFSLPEETDCKISWLAYCSELEHMGNIGSPEYLYTLTQCRRQEKDKPSSRHCYRIVRKDGNPIRIDRFLRGKLKDVRLFEYRGNVRYCFTCSPEGIADVNTVEAVCLEDGQFTWEYCLDGHSLTYLRYRPTEDGKISVSHVEYYPRLTPAVRLHRQGIYRIAEKARYKETFLWIYTDGNDPTVNKLISHRIKKYLGRVAICVATGLLLFYPLIIMALIFGSSGYWPVVQYSGPVLVAALVILFIFGENRRRTWKTMGILLLVYILLFSINTGYIAYDQSLIIDTDPNINLYEYLPFDAESKIVTLDREASLQLNGDLPTLDGAAAVFPVYSAFVNAVYPETTELYDGTFEYNNTVGGYEALADKVTDVFFGAYPSEEQIAYAREQGTEFIYTQIGWEAFVFFVNADNPIDGLTTEQIKGIYSGQITNWKEAGGKNVPITPYQRNDGSGSQSMLIRFMGDTPIIEPDIEEVDGFMGGIIRQVADYRNKDGSIGFSFRYYVEGIIQNPNIKVLSVDGIAPTMENIRSGAYPITAPLYAVTYEGNENPNVELLLQWILSEEGQQILEETGYVPVNG